MKFMKCLLLFLCFLRVNKIYALFNGVEDSSSSVLVDAINTVIMEAIKRQKTVANMLFNPSDILIETERYHFSDMMTQILNQIPNFMPVRLENSDHIKNFKVPRSFNIFFVRNYNSLINIYNNIRKETYNYQGNYLIVVTKYYEGVLMDIDKMLTDFWAMFIINVDILVESENSTQAHLYTFFPYTKLHCSKVHSILWKIFSNDQFEDVRNFYPWKMDKLYNCPIKVVTFDTPLMIISENLEGKHKFSGLDGKLLREISKIMEFEIQLTYMPLNSSRWGYLLENGTSGGAMKMVSALD